ncbi:MAG: uracil-DNA glycosylase [Aquidulcibacter sp.]|jgi:uracil-DNA glycosylase family 4|uniref:uracil-DNA glycosylase n=1 Tax=Aquidulcibacter sp. TaxID=2052990 RepID=UPI0022C0DFF5|nr:uracil-DNA glycosylase [Aquidulcibacter sp.]MCE2892704.1 uracil-DNA glycosylase [Hyphomonadaceae bacterium]MCZ8206656.1 uracil-DNA glycosylase [Aquidulcibacter sp.]
MHVRPSLTVETAAQALAQWWELAGLEPFDFGPAQRARAQAQQGQAVEAPAAEAKTTPARITNTKKPVDALAEAHRLAQSCTSLDALYKALESFDGCGLKANARNTVFADGRAEAEIMVIGETAGREDDEIGKPFQGLEGDLLTKMLASIGLDRQQDCYLTCLIPWRPPGNRNPTAEEVALCRPFLVRHLELAAPKAVLMVGGVTAQTLLSTSDGIMKLRNRSFDYGLSGDAKGTSAYVQCLFSPAYLLNRPRDKALAWQDLLRFEQKISALGVATRGRNGAKDN